MCRIAAFFLRYDVTLNKLSTQFFSATWGVQIAATAHHLDTLGLAGK